MRLLGTLGADEYRGTYWGQVGDFISLLRLFFMDCHQTLRPTLASRDEETAVRVPMSPKSSFLERKELGGLQGPELYQSNLA